MTDLEIVRSYLDWQYAIHRSVDLHLALVREDRPMPTIEEARAALDRIEEEGLAE